MHFQFMENFQHTKQQQTRDINTPTNFRLQFYVFLKNSLICMRVLWLISDGLTYSVISRTIVIVFYFELFISNCTPTPFPSANSYVCISRRYFVLQVVAEVTHHCNKFLIVLYTFSSVLSLILVFFKYKCRKFSYRFCYRVPFYTPILISNAVPHFLLDRWLLHSER